MKDAIIALKDELSSLLNSSAFSTDSIEGWILILLVGFIIWNIYKKSMKFIVWSINTILLFQVCYWLSLTGLNDLIPLSKIFKYDVLTSIAQCFAGTKICDGLLWFNAALQVILTTFWDKIGDFVYSIKDWITSI